MALHGAGPPDVLDVPSVDWVLGTARSVRRHLDLRRPVPLETLYDCIDVAVQAPTGTRGGARGGESWRFLVVRAPAPKQALAELYRAVLDDLMRDGTVTLKATQRTLADRLHEMPVLILICALGAPPATVHGQVAFYGSVLPAAWSLMVSLRARGLGATWTTLLSSRQREVAALLDIPEDVTQTVMLPVAFVKGAQLKPAERQPARDVTFCDRWGEAPDQ